MPQSSPTLTYRPESCLHHCDCLQWWYLKGNLTESPTAKSFNTHVPPKPTMSQFYCHFSLIIQVSHQDVYSLKLPLERHLKLWQIWKEHGRPGICPLSNIILATDKYFENTLFHSSKGFVFFLQLNPDIRKTPSLLEKQVCTQHLSQKSHHAVLFNCWYCRNICKKVIN